MELGLHPIGSRPRMNTTWSSDRCGMTFAPFAPGQFNRRRLPDLLSWQAIICSSFLFPLATDNKYPAVKNHLAYRTMRFLSPLPATRQNNRCYYRSCILLLIAKHILYPSFTWVQILVWIADERLKQLSYLFHCLAFTLGGLNRHRQLS